MIRLENAGLRHAGRWLVRGLTLEIAPNRCVALLGSQARATAMLIRALLGATPLDEGYRAALAPAAYVPPAGSAPMQSRVLDLVVTGCLTGEPQRATPALTGSPPVSLVSPASHASPASRALLASRAPTASPTSTAPTASPAPAAIDLDTPPHAHYRTAAHALDIVGLLSRGGQPFAALPAVERQLVLLARALATGARTILLDQPAIALDAAGEQRLLGVLNDLRRQDRYGIVFSTPLPRHARQIAEDTLQILPDGSWRHGATAAILGDPGEAGSTGVARASRPDARRTRSQARRR